MQRQREGADKGGDCWSQRLVACPPQLLYECAEQSYVYGRTLGPQSHSRKTMPKIKFNLILIQNKAIEFTMVIASSRLFPFPIILRHSFSSLLSLWAVHIPSIPAGTHGHGLGRLWNSSLLVVEAPRIFFSLDLLVSINNKFPRWVEAKLKFQDPHRQGFFFLQLTPPKLFFWLKVSSVDVISQPLTKPWGHSFGFKRCLLYFCYRPYIWSRGWWQPEVSSF